MDLALSDHNTGLTLEVKTFRYNLSVWRVETPKIRLEIQATIDRLRHLKELQPSLEPGIQKSVIKFSELLDLCDITIQRCERASQGLMAAMSITESQNAIQQGHEVQKLTELAFIFIPMSFAASYFGMEMQVREPNRRD